MFRNRKMKKARRLLDEGKYKRARREIAGLAANDAEAAQLLQEIHMREASHKTTRFGGGRMKLILGFLGICLGLRLCIFIGDSTGVLPDASETQAAETQIFESRTLVAETQFWVAATEVTFTPTASFTPTFTPSITLTASDTPLPSNTPFPSDTPLPTNTPRPTLTPTDVPTRTPQEEAERAIKNTRGTGLRDQDVERVIVNDRVVTLRYRFLRHFSDTDEYLDQAQKDFGLIICNLLSKGFTTQTFQFTGLIPTVDSFGNEGWSEGVEMILPADVAQQINCDNLEAVNFENIAERYDIHPLLD